MFRDGVKLLLSSGLTAEVIAEAINGKDFLSKIDANMPDVVLMDIAMPIMDGVETTKKVKEKYPDLKILALTMFGDEKYYYSMIQAGVKGFILKSAGISELIKAIGEVHQGGAYFSSELLVKLVDSITKQKDEVLSENDSISKREIEVLKLITAGQTNEEIAENLHISLTTVRTHRANLLSKTGCNNTASLVMYAIKKKLVEVD